VPATFTSSAWSVAACCARWEQVTIPLVTRVGVAAPVGVALALGRLILQFCPQPAFDCAAVSPPMRMVAQPPFAYSHSRPPASHLAGWPLMSGAFPMTASYAELPVGPPIQGFTFTPRAATVT
jgi:hypothetical protein